MNHQCMRCKGRLYCGRRFCALSAKFYSYNEASAKLSQDFSSFSVAPFVGQYGYPFVNVGILAPVEKSGGEFDSPRIWSQEKKALPELIQLRSSLINSRIKAPVKGTSRFIEDAQLLSMSKKPVDIEVFLEKKPVMSLRFDNFSAPLGPIGELKKMQVAENPKVDVHVEKVVSDDSFKASGGIVDLYKRGIDENFITRLLSIGNLGVKTQRRIVPTRWSITATDDIIARDMIGKIKDYQQGSYQAFFGGYLGNYFLVMLIPEVWQYELFETIAGNAEKYTTDYESYSGRKEYARETAGGYYAARLAVLENLNLQKKQASALVIRFITKDYALPMGVWVVREAVRNAVASTPFEFSSLDLMLAYARAISKKKFGSDIGAIVAKSIILQNVKKQKKLFQFA